MEETVWETECWVNGEFDFGTTNDTYEEAKAEFDMEVQRYKDNGSGQAWVETWEVKLFESHKQLVLREVSEGE